MNLAQLNIGRLRAPIDSPETAEFVENLDVVNTAAESAPGFVWRNVDEGSNNATTISPFPDPLIITNLSVWKSIDALGEFVRSASHRPFMLRRSEWFEPMREHYLVLWWIPNLHIPTLDEAIGRLDLLRAHGPTPQAFTFKDRFPPP